jgi:hypothetical protein
MARQGSQSRERRAADRANRRTGTPAPGAERQTEDQLPSEAAAAIWEAASAAIVGAAVGAAEAIARQRDAEHGDEPEAAADDVHGEPEELHEPEEPEPEPEPEAEAEEPAQPPQPQEPGRPGDAPKMVRRARLQLRELRGVDAESVSTVARTAGGWRVGLEVVELQRVPASTDVLATYEIELDADGELLALERTHRYHRSEANAR